jgi:hypothetical protein
MGDKMLVGVKIYDNEGVTFDRYTVVVNRFVYSMSYNPLSPQGVNQFVLELKKGERVGWTHIGKKLDYIPEEILYAVKARWRECRE